MLVDLAVHFEFFDPLKASLQLLEFFNLMGDFIFIEKVMLFLNQLIYKKRLRYPKLFSNFIHGSKGGSIYFCKWGIFFFDDKSNSVSSSAVNWICGTFENRYNVRGRNSCGLASLLKCNKNLFFLPFLLYGKRHFSYKYLFF